MSRCGTIALLATCCFSGCMTAPELCEVQGVSIIRMEDDSHTCCTFTKADEDEGKFPNTEAGRTAYEHQSVFGHRRADIESRGFTLPDLIAHFAGLPHELIFGWSVLPVGRYEVHATVRGEDITKELLFLGIERTFGVKMTFVPKEVDVLVVRKATNWEQVGFKKSAHDLFSYSGLPSEPGHEESWGERWRSAHLMQIVDGCSSHIHPRPLLIDETGIRHTVDAEMRVNRAAGIAGVQAALADHGLTLSAERRVMQVLVIEKKGAAQNAGGGPVPID
jgi:hypothetical protein